MYILIRERKSIFKATATYFVAFIGTAMPLILFFLKKQINNQRSRIDIGAFSFEGNIIRDMIMNFYNTVKWNLFSYLGNVYAIVFIIIFAVVVIITFIFTEKTYIRLLTLTNIITWLVYYFTVKACMYSYGNFGNRYNLFFIPLWVISAFCYGIDLYTIIRDHINGFIKDYYIGVCICFICCFMYLSWSQKLQYNWGKDNIRDAVTLWVSNRAQESQTIVYYGGGSGFSYYLRHHKEFSDDMEQNVNYMYWYRDKSIEEYTEYVNSIYGNIWPSEIYIIGNHLNDDFNTIMAVFNNAEYARTDLFNHGGVLIKLNKRIAENE